MFFQKCDGKSPTRALKSRVSTAALRLMCSVAAQSPNDFLSRWRNARAGMAVRLIIGAIGSLATPDSYFASLRRAGGEVAWYQPVRWHTLKRNKHRTRRELLVIDGATGLSGGAGVAVWWDGGGRQNSPWRDTIIRASGRVTNLSARLGDHAKAGQILLSSGTADQVRKHFALRSLGLISLKNMPHMEETWEIGARQKTLGGPCR